MKRLFAALLVTFAALSTTAVLSTTAASASGAKESSTEWGIDEFIRVTPGSTVPLGKFAPSTHGARADGVNTAAVGPYTWINAKSGKCLDHSSNGTGLLAYVYTCLGNANQLWYWDPAPNTGDAWKLRNAQSNKCLDHSSNGTGLDAYVYTCLSANRNQEWWLDYYPAAGHWRITNVQSNKCLDHSSNGTGLNAYVYTCLGNQNQYWD